MPDDKPTSPEPSAGASIPITVKTPQTATPAAPAPTETVPEPSPGTNVTDPPPTVPDPNADLPKPSATVQPFDSGGGPPPPPPAPKRGHGKLVLMIIVLLLAGAGGAYYYNSQGGAIPFLSKTAQPSSSPAAANDITQALRAADDSMADVTTNLTDSDTVLNDKQGDISE